MRGYLTTLSVVAALSISGCANSPFKSTRDPISAGTATLLLKVAKTSQSDVLEVFGGPNIVTGDAAGRQTWTYDRMSYESGSSSIGGAAAGAGAGSSGGGGGLIWGHAKRASTASRSVTLFLYWEDGVLADYKYRSASF